MTSRVIREASETEKKIAAAMRSPESRRQDIFKLTGELGAPERFVMQDTWVELALDETMETWRRLESYDLLIKRCITYPCDLEYFVNTAVTPLNINPNGSADATKSQYVPLERKENRVIQRIHLPILTTIGPAAVYFSVHRARNRVEDAAVFPDPFSAEIQ